MYQEKILDQFYTKPEIAEFCYRILEKEYDLEDCFLIEPSAGSGSFSDLFHSNSIAIDLEPKKEYIKKEDFFKFKIKNNLKLNKIFTIGNPPFGKKSSLALKFINKSAKYSDVIAFILPKSFKKTSIKNRIDLNIHLSYEINLPKNSFIYKDQEYDVPCVFQIWEKKKEKRDIIKERRTTDLFDFTKKETADFAIRRVGRLSGKVIIDFKLYNESNHYYIKSNIDKNKLLSTFYNSYLELNNIASNTAALPSLSKGELIKIIEDNNI